ncbi:hypothetical protein N0B31_02985 [Salinirubellus salinus]|uniref:Uncharacterized protein n=1 Tax=Salinirubellus salinus TaxID=1364945 RepID=A0A9E7R5X0_9EURY|nr:hypothetical protein [Salinirubellus salinus]UWM55255.1 hypothetical protein N0B31_02985 [Salinirubellus salinus]
MDRRALLAAGSAALAGCLPLRGSPRTPGANANEPQLRAEYEYLPGDSAYRVRHAAGNEFTAENTGALVVRVDPRDERANSRLWAGTDVRADDSDDGGATQSFPVGVGDEIRVPAPSRGDVRVVWTGPDGENSVSLDVYRAEEQPTPTPTPRPTADGTATEDG